jgi:hypothetical protein
VHVLGVAHDDTTEHDFAVRDDIQRHAAGGVLGGSSLDWTETELQGLAIQARMVALGVVGGGWRQLSPCLPSTRSSCRRRFWANPIPRFMNAD